MIVKFREGSFSAVAGGGRVSDLISCPRRSLCNLDILDIDETQHHLLIYSAHHLHCLRSKYYFPDNRIVEHIVDKKCFWWFKQKTSFLLGNIVIVGMF